MIKHWHYAPFESQHGNNNFLRTRDRTDGKALKSLGLLDGTSTSSRILEERARHLGHYGMALVKTKYQYCASQKTSYIKTPCTEFSQLSRDLSTTEYLEALRLMTSWSRRWAISVTIGWLFEEDDQKCV